jgi:uncharacterized membrane protein YgdD (TMEM256/DUF423 family)
MNKSLFATACVLMAIAIILGAFGAHSLQAKLSAPQLLSFETGVRYHVYHALALLIISFTFQKLRHKNVVWTVRLMLAGLFCFSGSIYLFTIGNLTGQSFSAGLWWVTPLGGLMLITSWLFLARSAFKADKVQH